MREKQKVAKGATFCSLIPLFWHFYKNSLHRSRGSTDSIQTKMRHIRRPQHCFIFFGPFSLSAQLLYAWMDGGAAFLSMNRFVRPTKYSNEYLMNSSHLIGAPYKTTIILRFWCSVWASDKVTIHLLYACVLASRQISALDIVRHRFFWCFSWKDHVYGAAHWNALMSVSVDDTNNKIHSKKNSRRWKTMNGSPGEIL